VTAALRATALHLCGLLPTLPCFNWNLDPVRREVAVIAYHFHWARKECMDLSRRERAEWIEEINRINKEIAKSVKGRNR
jgi:hypothetical protein